MGRISFLLLAGTSTFLVGCGESEIAKAERRFEMVKQGGTEADQCREAKAVESAYLNAGDQSGYKNAHSTAEIYCLSARLAR